MYTVSNKTNGNQINQINQITSTVCEAACEFQGLESRTLLSAGGTAGWNTAMGDVTGDGQAEIIAVKNKTGGGTQLKVNTVDENQIIAVLIGLLLPAVQKAQIAVGDMKGDHKNQIAVLGKVDTRGGAKTQISLLDTPLTKDSKPKTALLLPYIEQATLFLADFNNDGGGAKDDIGVFDGRKLHVFANDHKGSFTKSDELDTGFRGGVYVGVGDLDGDGRADVVATSGDKTRVFTHDSKGNFELKNTFTFKGGVSVAVGDVNGDGLADIVTMGDGSVKVIRGSDHGLLLPAVKIATPDVTKKSLLGDFNGDGTVDIISWSEKKMTMTDGAGLFAHGIIAI